MNFSHHNFFQILDNHARVVDLDIDFAIKVHVPPRPGLSEVAIAQAKTHPSLVYQVEPVSRIDLILIQHSYLQALVGLCIDAGDEGVGEGHQQRDGDNEQHRDGGCHQQRRAGGRFAHRLWLPGFPVTILAGTRWASPQESRRFQWPRRAVIGGVVWRQEPMDGCWGSHCENGRSYSVYAGGQSHPLHLHNGVDCLGNSVSYLDWRLQADPSVGNGSAYHNGVPLLCHIWPNANVLYQQIYVTL